LAATLLDVGNFYDQRFNLGFTNQQKDDLVKFPNAHYSGSIPTDDAHPPEQIDPLELLIS